MITSETTSLPAERFKRILDAVKTRRAVRVDDLCAELGVSAATIRRDLVELDRSGQLRKVHGGAVSLEGRLEEPIFDDKAAEAAAEKRAIATVARTYIQPNDCIYLDGGSTILALAEKLVDMHPLTVVTNSLRVATALASGSPRIMLVGGELRRLSQTFVGPLTQPMIEHVHVDKAFMGTLGLTLEDGMTTTDPAEAFTKRLIMQRASQVFLLADSRKFGKVAFAHAGSLQELDIIITDSKLDTHLERELMRQGLELIKAGAPQG
ncbi:MAG: DeoR/GlpR family DNA-binding transcription regulator [Lentisphaerae bacterium]|nr:DeoR/GlpR family DNA-binding transcription regulator [Lentisphaerota bacterium]